MTGTPTPTNTWLTRKATSYLKLMERLARKEEGKKAQLAEGTATTQKQKLSKSPREV